ncbi:hypothetical protein BH23GEM9_BH23GEM9_15690 [soil metagenome]
MSASTGLGIMNQPQEPDAQLAELKERVSEAERAQESANRYAQRMRFLAQAGTTLSGSLDYETTLRNVARLAVPAVADWCVIHLLDESGELKRLAVVHQDPAMVEFVEDMLSRYPEDPDSRHGVHHVVRTGVPQLVPEITPGLLEEVARDAEHRSIIESLELGSFLIVPLPVRGRILGALTLVCGSGSRCYGSDDLEMAQELAARAALAIDNARLVSDLERTRQHLEETAAELETQAEELQATIEELETTTQDLLAANEGLTRARLEADRERVAAEEARQVAEEANAAKAQFLATMSHELRTPLNAIDGYAELMELGIHGPVSDQQRTALQRLRRAQKRLLSLINDVLNFAKLEAGQVHFSYTSLSIAEILAEVKSVIAPQFEVKDQVLVIDRVPADLLVWADPERAEQILLNLLGNAMKFTAAGSRITVSATVDGAHALISVADTGAGIPSQRLATIFDPFVQVESGMVREHGGVGLGLSISRDLARAMGGDVRAESSVGIGSIFTLVLPLATDAHSR